MPLPNEANVVTVLEFYTLINNNQCPDSLTIRPTEFELMVHLPKLVTALTNENCKPGIHLDFSSLKIETHVIDTLATIWQHPHCPLDLYVNLHEAQIYQSDFIRIAKALVSGRCQEKLHLDLSKVCDTSDKTCALFGSILKVLISPLLPKNLDLNLSHNPIDHYLLYPNQRKVFPHTMPTLLCYVFNGKSDNLKINLSYNNIETIKFESIAKIPANLEINLCGNNFSNNFIDQFCQFLGKFNDWNNLKIDLQKNPIDADLLTEFSQYFDKESKVQMERRQLPTQVTAKEKSAYIQSNAVLFPQRKIDDNKNYAPAHFNKKIDKRTMHRKHKCSIM